MRRTLTFKLRMKHSGLAGTVVRKQAVTGGWIKLDNKECHHLQRLSRVTGVNKSRMMRW